MICEVAAARGGSGGGRELLHTVKITDHAVKVTDQAAVAGGRGSCCTPERGSQDASHGGKKVPSNHLVAPTALHGV
jgi:hypothetical protein